MEFIKYFCISGMSIILFVLLTDMTLTPPDPCREHMTMASHWDQEPVKLMCWNEITQQPKKCKE